MNYQRVPIAKFSNQYTVRWWFFEALTSFDADNDGDLDILVGMTGAIWDPKLSTDPKPYLIENLGNGEFKLSDFWASGSPSVAGWINNLVPGDYNEDDKIDILVVDHGREDKPYEIG